LDGGAGTDTVSYADAAGAVTVDLEAGEASGDGADTLISIENVTGSAFDDTLSGTAGVNVIDGGAGFDTVSYAAASADMRIDLTTGQAGAGNFAGFTAGTLIDQLSNVEAVIGSAQNDVILAIDGARLDGGDGDDLLIDAAGSETF